MYIPYTELKMWNSRLYCNYCIMDIQDEEEMVRKAGRKEGKESEKILPELPSSGIGTCERCGKQAQQLYLFFGRKLCLQCYNSSSEQGQPPTSGPSLFGQIVRLLSSGFRDRRQPRIIAAQQIKEKPKEVFDIGLRRMVPQKSEIELAAPLIEEKKKDRIAKKKGAKSRLLSFLGFKRQ
ncbi:MAG: hypothetical protein N3G22_02530 [Candidatus Micrarchaeota archaeon]|nr:hypothetical protein [Candidatus Micrarchaeota archaeon]